MSIRSTWPLLALLALGCGRAPQPAKSASATSAKPNATLIQPKVDTSKPQQVEPEWQTMTSDLGISLRLPQGWKQEQPTKGNQSDDQGARANGILNVKVAISAVSSSKATADSFPDTLTAVRALQSQAVPIDQKYADDTLSDLKTNFPDGHAQVNLIKIPVGPAVLATYEDRGTVGISKGTSTTQNKVVDVLNVQLQVEKGQYLYVIQLTGAKRDQSTLVDLANEVALTVRLD